MNLDDMEKRGDELVNAMFALDWSQPDERGDVLMASIGDLNAQEASEVLTAALLQAVDFGRACIGVGEDDPEIMRALLTSYGIQRRKQRAAAVNNKFLDIVEPLDSIPWPTWTDDE